MNFIENQEWRYATKKFDATKKVSSTDLETIKKAIRLSTSSFGLQPYQVIDVQNKEIRAQLLPVSWGQQQVVDASHLFVFAGLKTVDANYIKGFIKNMAETRSISEESISGYGDFMESKIATLPEEYASVWTAKQCYLALANLINVAAELKIDVTPMEGFEAEKYNEILGLDKHNLNAVLVATIGYRHEEDATQHYKKVRKPESELFITL
jgi:nitroreductase